MSEHLRPVRGSIAAASAALIVLTLAGCVQAETQTATEPSAAAPTASTEPSADPTPVVEPLVLPECSTMVPLDLARSWLSRDTILSIDEDFFTANEWFMPEEATVISNASLVKNCVWAVPRSDGFLLLKIFDVDPAEGATLAAALVDDGAVETTMGDVTVLKLLTLGGLNDLTDTHYFIDDIWVHSNANSDEVSTWIADAALEQIRVANPTHAY